MNIIIQIILGTAGAVTALGIIWHSFLKPLWTGLKRGEEIWQNVNTLSNFQEEVRGYMIEMRDHKEFVNHELNYNSGSSVKDQVRAAFELGQENNKLLTEHLENTPND